MIKADRLCKGVYLQPDMRCYLQCAGKTTSLGKILNTMMERLVSTQLMLSFLTLKLVFLQTEEASEAFDTLFSKSDEKLTCKSDITTILTSIPGL